ncbi:replication associated protein [Chifec virus UA13_110]|nr:replication associated protein [Chifec virus UA13_110]
MSQRTVRRKYKSWVFTSFNIENEPSFDVSKDEYIIYGRETCPDTGRQHWQGYVVYKNRQYLSYCQKKIPGAHFERARGTPTECSEYCKKDGEFTEHGTLPKVTSGGGAFKASILAAEKGDLASVKDAYPGVYLRYKKTLESLRSVSSVELSGSCGFWLCGPPRSGKDFAVMEKYKGSLFNKPLNKWWDGYEGEENVLISDLDHFHAPSMGYFLKIWCDRYAFTAEIKGGSMKIRPKRIFVTSNFSLENLFEGQVLCALQARFDVFTYDVVDDKITHLPKPVIPASDRFLRALENVLPSLVQEEEIVSSVPQISRSRSGSSSSSDFERPGPSTKRRL